MPFHKNPYRFGNLFVLFKVKSPEHISDSQAAEVRQLLKGMAKKTDANMDVAETVKLIPFSNDQKNPHAQGGTKGIDSDEEGDEDPRMGGGQRVQCAQQ